MTSCSKIEAVNAATFNLMTGYLVVFVRRFTILWPNLGAHMIDHVSEVGLYIILSTLKSLNPGIGQF